MSETNSPWPTLPLGQIASEMCLGKMLDKHKNRGELQPYLRNVNVRWISFDLSDLKEMRFEESEQEKYGLRDGDLVVCEGGEPGRSAVWRGESNGAKIQKALHRIRFDSSQYEPRFAMYYLYHSTLSNRLAHLYTGTTISHLTGQTLSRIPFPVPPPAEQFRIVERLEELLSDVDAGVAALERARGNLKKYRAAVLRAAVSGELSAEWRAAHPDAEPAASLLARVLAERRRKWEADQEAKFAAARKTPPNGWRDKYADPQPPDAATLGELPAGWVWASVEQLAEIQGGIQKQPKRAPGKNAYPFLRVANVYRGRLELDNVHNIELFDGELDKLRLLKDDVLIVEGNGSASEIGRSAIWNDAIPNCVHQNHLIRVRLRHCIPKFFDAYWNSPLGSRKVQHVAASTSGLYTLSVFKIAGLPIPLPPLAEQEAIVAEVERQLSVIAATEASIGADLKRAGRLRQSVLKEAFAGRLVPQDPADEPAAALLERVREARGAAAGVASPRRRRVSLNRPPLPGLAEETP